MGEIEQRMRSPRGPYHNLSTSAGINNSHHCLLVSGEYELSFWCTSRLVGKVVETAFPEDQVATLPCRGRERGRGWGRERIRWMDKNRAIE